MDTYEGDLTDPPTQNLYAYVYDDPIEITDPSGHAGETQYTALGKAVHAQIVLDFLAWLARVGHKGAAGPSIKTILGLPKKPRPNDIYTFPDLIDITSSEIYEIKPAAQASAAYADLEFYMAVAISNGTVWLPGQTFNDARSIPLDVNNEAQVSPTNAGAILYTVNSKTSPSPQPVLVPVPVPMTGDTLNEQNIQKWAVVSAAVVASGLALGIAASSLTSTQFAF
jgi:hypothetical protein